MEKLYEALGTVIGTLVIFLISYPIMYKIKKMRMKTRFGKRMQADDEINKILQEIRSAYGFNRSALIEYHNGIESLAGFGFKHATMTHESVDDVTKPMIMDFQNIPTSLLSDILPELEKSQTGYVVINTKTANDEEVKITQRMLGVNQAWDFRLGNSLVNGCLTLNSTAGSVDLSNEDILDIKAKCQKILLIKRGFIP